MKSKNIKKIIIIVFALVAIASGFYFAFRKSRGVEAAWYGDTWLYRKKITIDHTKVKGKLNNFPVLASTTDSSLASFAQADGDDILFTSSDGRTKLNHEIEKYDSATGQLVSWVQAGLSSTTDTVLYMYYGNSTCGEQSTSTLVWDDNYKMVQHMHHDWDATAVDSTKNNNDGTNTNFYSATSTVGAQIDGGIDFDGSDDYIKTENVFSLNNLTLETWIKPKNLSSWQMIVGSYSPNYWILRCSSNNLVFTYTDNNNGGMIISNNQWYHVVGTYDGTNKKLYVNGMLISNLPVTAFSITNQATGIGAYPNGNFLFDGTIDEVRISNIARSAGWIETEYNNQSSPSTFMSWGDHQSKTVLYGAGGLPPILYLKFDEGFGITAYDSSDYQNDATITGPTWKNEVFCKTGKCLDFDGANDYLTRAYDTDFSFSTSSFSLSTWFLTNTVSASSTIASRHVGAGWKLWMDADGDICFGIDDDTDWGGASPDDSACTTNKNYDDNNWHHLTAYRDGTTGIYLYADGQQVASDTSLSATNSLSGTSPSLYLGIETNGTSSPFKGRLDDFKIYGYARNATQIASDYGIAGTSRGGSVSLGSRATSTISGAPDLTTGLVGYWDFELATSTDKAVDRSGNENYGMLGGGTASAMPAWTKLGKKGKALQFDGVDDYVDCGDGASLNITDAITIEAWAKFSLSQGNKPIIAKWGADQAYILAISWLSGNKISGGVRISNINKVITTSISYNDNKYHHYVMTYNGSYVNLYVDGIAETPLAVTGLIDSPPNNPLAIGGYNQPISGVFNGTIDEVRIYNRALSQREISWLYNNGKPLAEWHFRNNYNDTGSWCENNVGTSECKTLTAAGTGNTFATSTLELETSSLRLNGSGYATIADDVNLDIATGTDFSLTTTFMTTDTGNVVLTAKRNTDSGAGYLLGLDYGLGDGKVFFEVGDGTDEFQIQGATNLADGEWHTVTVVFNDDSTAGNKIYVDGRDDTAATSGTLINVGPLSNTLAFTVGAESDGGGAFTGKIDRVAFFGYTLTAEDAKKEVLGTKAVKIGQHIADSQGSDPLGGKPPVAWWKLDERSGTTATDYASSTLNGTWNGTGNHFAPGKIGYAGQFNGSNDYVKVFYSNNLDFKGAEKEFTLSAWIKVNSLISDGGIIGRWRNDSGLQEQYVLKFESDTNDIKFAVNDGGYQIAESSANTITTNNWIHVSGVADGTTLKVYINGVASGTTDTYGTIIDTGAHPLDIGASSVPDSISVFNGLIDNVKIYDYARTPAQIAWDYNQGRPIAHWKFDDGTGATTQDASENNYDGTITGASWSTSGKIFNALSFDGSGDEVSTTDVAISGASTYSEVSFGAWVYPSTSIASKAILIKNTEFRLVTDSTGRALCQIHNGTSWQVAATSTNALSLGTWQHVMCYYDKTNIKLYLNGQEDDSVSLTQTVNNGSVVFEIGDDVGGTYGDYQGLIDDVRIYNYARPASFILLDYNNGASARF